jgi:hypothetical protein
MRETELDIPHLMRLIDEVAEILHSPVLFSGSDETESKDITFGDDSVYSWKVVDISEYLWSIDIKRDDTPYLDLNELLSTVEKSYRFFDSYAPISVIDKACQKPFENFHKVLDKSSGAQKLIDSAYRADNQHLDRDKYYEHVLNTVMNHFSAIVYARITTLSRRFPVTEVLLDAYAAGLFPFGWSFDDDCALCVRP